MTSTRKGRAPKSAQYPTLDAVHPKTGVFMIGPKEAALLLKRNVSNRPVRQAHVRRNRDEMERSWHVTNDAISIDENGELVNGQHRLMAIVMLDEPRPFLVVVDIDPDAYAVLDQGIRRNAADVLAEEGYVHPHIAAAGARLEALRIRRASDSRCSNAEVSAAAAKITHLHEATEYYYENRHEIRGLCSKGAAVAFLSHLFHAAEQTEDGELRSYASRVLLGIDVKTDSIEHSLRRRLLRERVRPSTGINAQLTDLYLLCRGWNAVEDGEEKSFFRDLSSRMRKWKYIDKTIARMNGAQLTYTEEEIDVG